MIDINELQNIKRDISLLDTSYDLYTCEYNGKKYIYKQLDDFDKTMVNRFSQLMKLNEPNLNIPKHIVSTDNMPTAYLSKPLYNYKELFDLHDYNINQRIKFLKLAKEKIITMHKCGIIHCDLHPANIMFNDSCNGVKIIDFDNCFVMNIMPNIDNIASFIKEYIKNNGIDNSVDTFMFNLDVIDLYYGIYFDCIFSFKDIVDKSITDDKQTKIWQKMKRFEKLNDDDYLIDYL